MGSGLGELLAVEGVQVPAQLLALLRLSADAKMHERYADLVVSPMSLRLPMRAGGTASHAQDALTVEENSLAVSAQSSCMSASMSSKSS